jgi:hypothetical protein
MFFWQAVLERVSFEVEIATTEGLPTGYLFLCPVEDFQIGPSSFSWPEFPAYWSVDGVECLTMEEATSLGFPSFQLTTRIVGRHWDDDVFAGIRKFHKAKRFDPDGQDVALHLGQTLYQLTTEIDPNVSLTSGEPTTTRILRKRSY